MPTERILPLPVILQMKAMYEERDQRGQRRYSYETLGLAFGASGTTVLRVIRGLGPYANVGHLRPEAKGADEMLAELAQASALRVASKLKESDTDGSATARLDEGQRGEALRKLQHASLASIERDASEPYPDESSGKQ